MWDLWLGHMGSSSLTKDQTGPLLLGVQNLSLCISRGIPAIFKLAIVSMLFKISLDTSDPVPTSLSKTGNSSVHRLRRPEVD